MSVKIKIQTIRDKWKTSHFGTSENWQWVQCQSYLQDCDWAMGSKMTQKNVQKLLVLETSLVFSLVKSRKTQSKCSFLAEVVWYKIRRLSHFAFRPLSFWVSLGKRDKTQHDRKEKKKTGNKRERQRAYLLSSPLFVIGVRRPVGRYFGAVLYSCVATMAYPT